jgi:hypothetical protein
MTQRTAYLLAAGLLLIGTLASQASDETLIQKVYPVADLVVPVDNATAASGNYLVQPGSSFTPEAVTKPTLEAPLMKLIVDYVAPDSWSGAGGKGTIDYFPLGMAMVVSQVAEVHEQIGAMLESLRRNAGKEVGVEIRVISISEEMAKAIQARHDIDCFRCAREQTDQPQVSYLSDIELFLLMEELQADRTAEVMQAPKMTVLNGQAATCGVMDDQWFLHNVQVLERAGQAVFVPEKQQIPIGWNFAVQPVVSGDEKSTRVKLDMTFTIWASATVPLFPITTFITPVFEGGAQGQPVPITKFVQQPTFTTWTVKHMVNVPANSTAVLSGWKIEREARWEGPPVLSHIPYVRDLFRLFTTTREPRYMLVLVTPRVVEQTEASETSEAPAAAPQPVTLEPAARAMPAPVPTFNNVSTGLTVSGGWCWPAVGSCVQPAKCEVPATKSEPDFMGEVRKEMAALLVRKYHEACQKGLTAEAKCIAEEALELDSTCFSKAWTNAIECK